MPAKIIKKRASRKLRKGLDQRSKQQAAGCKRMQPAKSTNAIIADSISSLRLKPKGGAEVFLMAEEETSIRKIYTDLKAAYISVAQMLKVESIYFKALEQLPMQVQLDWIIVKLRSLLPLGFDLEIKQSVDYKAWCFVIFKELDHRDQFEVIFVENALAYLNKINPRLHNLFVEFLKILVNKIHVSGWWDSYADQFMEQEIGEFEHEKDRDEEYYQSLIDSVKIYRKGLPAKYERKINSRKYMNPAILAKKLNLIKQDRELVNVLIEGCKFLREPYKLTDFGYAAEDRMNDAGLHFEDHSSIMWTSTDRFYAFHEDFLNTDAQEGLFLPTIYKIIDKNIQQSDFEWLRNGEDWPVRFSNFIDSLNEILNIYERIS